MHLKTDICHTSTHETGKATLDLRYNILVIYLYLIFNKKRYSANVHTSYVLESAFISIKYSNQMEWNFAEI